MWSATWMVQSSRTRPLPLEAAFLLGQHAKDPGFVQFLMDARDDGFVLESSADDDLGDDEYRETVISRARILTSAWKQYSAQMAENDGA